MPEFRAIITVAGLPVEDEARWGRLATVLDRDHAEFGPVLSWDGGNLQVVLATEAPKAAQAAAELRSVVSNALAVAGLADVSATAVEVEQLTPCARSSQAGPEP
jgi:2C-methyl-D-erythritol 2,4-cyclodiphosphate synthase